MVQFVEKSQKGVKSTSGIYQLLDEDRYTLASEIIRLREVILELNHRITDMEEELCQMEAQRD